MVTISQVIIFVRSSVLKRSKCNTCRKRKFSNFGLFDNKLDIITVEVFVHRKWSETPLLYHEIVTNHRKWQNKRKEWLNTYLIKSVKEKAYSISCWKKGSHPLSMVSVKLIWHKSMLMCLLHPLVSAFGIPSIWRRLGFFLAAIFPPKWLRSGIKVIINVTETKQKTLWWEIMWM